LTHLTSFDSFDCFTPIFASFTFRISLPLCTSFNLFDPLWTSLDLFWPLLASFHHFSPLFISFHIFSSLFTSFHLFSPLFTSFHLFSHLFSALLHNREDSAERDLARVGITDPLPHAVQLVEYGSNHYNFARSAYISLLLLCRKQRRLSLACLKGECHEIFCFWFFSSVSFPPGPRVSQFCQKFASTTPVANLPLLSTTATANLQICCRCKRHQATDSLTRT
jgi:hypothetical protein